MAGIYSALSASPLSVLCGEFGLHAENAEILGEIAEKENRLRQTISG